MNDDQDFQASATAHNRLLVLDLIGAGVVTEADVAHLRRNMFTEQGPSRVEIEDLFALDAVAKPVNGAWVEFLVETATDYFVWDLRPTGTLSEADANWLLAKVDAASTVAVVALLINILEGAHRVPHWFPKAVRARAAAAWADHFGALAQAA